ncbi:noncompact myelin-associated protein [Brachyhypopomus gauderio]|uniref:noncompact myelin-associated protein n=1 Tax=Brachyhypopomus gauderio TaxID=698409 RepID=UPI00404369BD
MPAATVQPRNSSTTTYNTSNTTKSTEQILIQSSGAMIAIIVIGIVIILAILLIILKTYNRKTHAARVLSGSKPRQHNTSSTTHTIQMANLRAHSGGRSFAQAAAEGGLARGDAGRASEQLSTNSGSTVATIHDTPSVGNT